MFVSIITKNAEKCDRCDVCVFVFQPVESTTEDKKKGKVEKVKKCIRTAAGSSWEDSSLLEWELGKDQSEGSLRPPDKNTVKGP